MVPLPLNGNEGDVGEQKFSKVHVSRLGWTSGDTLTDCRGAVEHNLPMPAAPEFINIPRVFRRRSVYRIITAQSTAIIVAPGCTACPLNNIVMTTLTYIRKSLHCVILQYFPGTAKSYFVLLKFYRHCLNGITSSFGVP